MLWPYVPKYWGAEVVSDKDMDWKYANRVQNTIIFSQYLNAVKCGRIGAKPEVFRGDLPIRHIDDIIKDSLLEVRYLRGGWSIIKMPGRDDIIVATSNGVELISALKNILDNDNREADRSDGPIS